MTDENRGVNARQGISRDALRSIVKEVIVQQAEVQDAEYAVGNELYFVCDDLSFVEVRIALEGRLHADVPDSAFADHPRFEHSGLGPHPMHKIPRELVEDLVELYVRCSDLVIDGDEPAQERVCPRCRGTRKVGGFLGLFASPCPDCSGA